MLAEALERRDDILLCRFIIVTLGKLGDRRAVPILLEHLPEVQNRREMVEALGALGDPAAVPALVESLQHDAYVPVRAAAATALAQIGRGGGKNDGDNGGTNESAAPRHLIAVLTEAARHDTEPMVVAAARAAAASSEGAARERPGAGRARRCPAAGARFRRRWRSGSARSSSSVSASRPASTPTVFIRWRSSANGCAPGRCRCATRSPSRTPSSRRCSTSGARGRSSTGSRPRWARPGIMLCALAGLGGGGASSRRAAARRRAPAVVVAFCAPIAILLGQVGVHHHPGRPLHDAVPGRAAGGDRSRSRRPAAASLPAAHPAGRRALDQPARRLGGRRRGRGAPRARAAAAPPPGPATSSSPSPRRPR